MTLSRPWAVTVILMEMMVLGLPVIPITDGHRGVGDNNGCDGDSNGLRGDDVLLMQLYQWLQSVLILTL